MLFESTIVLAVLALASGPSGGQPAGVGTIPAPPQAAGEPLPSQPTGPLPPKPPNAVNPTGVPRALAEELKRKPVRAMTLQEALTYARSYQPSLLAARARLVGSEAEASIPGTLYLPRLAATAQGFYATANNSTSSYVNVSGLDIPRISSGKVGTKSWDPYLSTIVAAGLRQEVFDFGRIAALQAVANASVIVTRNETDVTRLDVDYAVENTYYAVQSAKGVLVAAEEAYKRSKLNFDTATAGVNAGLREPIELYRAEADLSRFDVARVRALGSLDVAQSVFAAVVGVPELMLDAAGEAPPPALAPTLDGAIAMALQKDPLLRERRAALTVQQSTTEAILATLRPDFSITSAIWGYAGNAPPSSGTNPPGGGVPNIPNWDVGLVMTVPILDFSVLARADASRAFELARQAEVEEVKERLLDSVQKAFVDLDAAELALPALEKELTAARANYNQAEARFKNELGSSVELADAQALLTTAEIDVTVGRFAVSQARAKFGRVIAEGL